MTDTQKEFEKWLDSLKKPSAKDAFEAGYQVALAKAEADKADLVKQCARVANEYRLDKHGHMRLVDVMMTLLLKE